MNDSESWIQSYTGEVIRPLSSSPGNIRIDDIAHSLSMQCRYTGHCTSFFSVSEHCCHVSDVLRERVGFSMALYGLLHDASEAYLSDVPRPIKPLLNGYQEAENRLLGIILNRFGLRKELPHDVHIIDKSMLAVEKEAVMVEVSGMSWELEGIVPLPSVEIQCWNPREAEVEFLKRFFTLCPERYW